MKSDFSFQEFKFKKVNKLIKRSDIKEKSDILVIGDRKIYYL